MLRWMGTLCALLASCSQAEHRTSAEAAERVPIGASQDVRCQDPVVNGLAPGTFKYGVVSSPPIAKEAAVVYLQSIFGPTDVPVDRLLSRPLTIQLRNGVWHVATTVPEGALGAQLFVEICQSNGRVLKLTGAQ